MEQFGRDRDDPDDVMENSLTIDYDKQWLNCVSAIDPTETNMQVFKSISDTSIITMFITKRYNHLRRYVYRIEPINWLPLTGKRITNLCKLKLSARDQLVKVWDNLSNADNSY